MQLVMSYDWNQTKFAKKFKPVNISVAARFNTKMLYGLERSFRRLQITRHSRRLPRKESVAMLPNMLPYNIASKLLSTLFWWNEVSLAFDEFLLLIILLVCFRHLDCRHWEEKCTLKFVTLHKLWLDCSTQSEFNKLLKRQCLPFG